MNKHILMVIDHKMNPEKYTQDQLEENYKTADAAAAAADAAADYNTYAAARAARAAAAYAAAYRAARTAYWLNNYFKESGECEQDYIDAINKDK